MFRVVVVVTLVSRFLPLRCLVLIVYIDAERRVMPWYGIWNQSSLMTQGNVLEINCGTR